MSDTSERPYKQRAKKSQTPAARLNNRIIGEAKQIKNK
jgi:hypothetical protein